MPKKRVPQPAPRWSDLLAQTLQARRAKDWGRVARLLRQLHTAPDAPSTDRPSQEVLVWYKLQAEFWEYQAAYWREQAAHVAATQVSVAEVDAITRGVLRTLVRRIYESLDAAGAPNPTVHDVCRELLGQVEGRSLTVVLEEELLELERLRGTKAASRVP